MIRSRIAFCFTALCLIAFYIFYMDYFSYYLLLYAACVAAFSLLCFLPAALCARCTLIPVTTNVQRGHAFEVDFAVENPLWLPFLPAGAYIHFTNLMTGETTRERVRLMATLRPKSVRIAHIPAHCGLIRCETRTFKVYSLFGVLSWKKRGGAGASVLSLPEEKQLHRDIDLSLPAEYAASQSGPKDPYGNYDIREYRQGDPLRAVHWKASAKLNGLYVKDFNERAAAGVALGVELFGGPIGADAIMGYAAAFMAQMLRRNIPFTLFWRDPEKEEILSRTIETGDDVFAGLTALLSCRAHDGGGMLTAGLDIQDKRIFQPLPDGIFDVMLGVYAQEV